MKTMTEKVDLSTRILDEDSETTHDFWKTIFELSAPYRGKLILSVVCSIFVGAAVALQPICVKWIVDSGMMLKGADGQLAPVRDRLLYACLFILLYIFLSVFRMGVWTLGYRGYILAIEDMLCRLRGRLFRHVQGLCYRFHDQVSSGEVFSYIMGTPMASLRLFLQQFSMFVPFQIVSLAVAVGTLASFNLTMTLITLIMIFGIVYINHKSRYTIKEISSDFMKTESEASRYVSDMLRGARAVKMYVMEETVNEHFDFHAKMMRNQGVLQTVRRQLEGLKPESMQYLGIALIYLAGTLFVVSGKMELGEFFAFVTSVSVLMGPIMMMMQLNLVRGNAEAGLERIMRIIEVRETTVEPSTSQEIDYVEWRDRARATGVPCVEFQGVRFSYDSRREVLKGVDCAIGKGEHVALVGPSGSGKSSFVSLLLRFYDPTIGSVRINGADIRRYNSRELRSRIGVVPQNPFIFQASVVDNVKVTKPAASQAEIDNALELAHLSEFIKDLPDGKDAFLGEGGSNLSGGQRQRVSIARAALQKPDIFIFDEATSALDNSSERHIMEALKSLTDGVTTIIIAHRLSTIKHVDRILVFDDGRIIQDGTYDELANKEGLFKQLVRDETTFR